MKKIVNLIVLVICLTACTYKKVNGPVPVPVNTIQPPAVCDTFFVSYSCIVKPILKSNCYQCHSSVASDSGKVALDLENFQSFKTYLKLFYRGDSIYGSKFYNTILQSPLTLRMPPAPNNKLQDLELREIKRWINAGANNN